MKRLLQLIVLPCLLSNGSAQTIPQLKTWEDTLGRSSLKSVAEKLQEPRAPKWPRIESAYAYEQLPENQRQAGVEALALADSLRGRLEVSFRPDVQMDEQALRQELDVLASIKKALTEAGGYSNLVLQDSVGRLMIFRLSGWLIDNPTRVSEAESLFGRIDVPQINLQALFSQLANQDREMAEKLQAIGSIKSEESIYRALEPIGLNMNSVLGFNDPDRVKTSELLKRASAPALAYRMVTTEALKWVYLRGLMQFFKAGGFFAELNPADVRSFEARMGKEAKRYKYPLLDIRSLTEGHLLALIGLQREADQKRVFLEVALK